MLPQAPRSCWVRPLLPVVVLRSPVTPNEDVTALLALAQSVQSDLRRSGAARLRVTIW